MLRIKQLRESKGLNMKEAARILNMPYTTYVNYEKGLREPTSEVLVQLANFYETTVDFLVGRSTNHCDFNKSTVLPDNILPMPRMKEWKVLGGTACGDPLYKDLGGETVLAPEDIDADYVFRCVGDSMINARIFDGDIVFVKTDVAVEDGQIAVVRIDEEYTLKRIFHGPDYLELRSENPTHPTRIIRGDQVNAEIVGRAVYFLSRVV